MNKKPDQKKNSTEPSGLSTRDMENEKQMPADSDIHDHNTATPTKYLADSMESMQPGGHRAPPAATDHASLHNLIPDSEEDRKLLEERAKHLASAKKTEKEVEPEHFIRFRLGISEQYGISFRFAEEVVSATEIIPVPCAPDYIAGVMNLRGELLSIIDLRHFFRIGTKTELQRDPADSHDVVVVTASELTTGLLVDEVLGDGTYQPERLEPSLPPDNSSKVRHVAGICTGNIAIIDAEALLADTEIRNEHP